MALVLINDEGVVRKTTPFVLHLMNLFRGVWQKGLKSLLHSRINFAVTYSIQLVRIIQQCELIKLFFSKNCLKIG